MREFVKEKAKYILIGLWFIVYPLMMTDGYFNVSTTKSVTFMVITLLAFSYYAWNDFSDWMKKNNGVIVPEKGFGNEKWN